MDAPVEALAESALLAFLFFLLPLGVLAVVAKFSDRALDRRWYRRHQPVETPHDFDDWRDPVAPFYRSRFESRTRSRLVIAARCGADPEKKTPARVESPGVLTHMEETHASTR